MRCAIAWAALAIACAEEHAVGVEPWATPPELRVAIVADGDAVEVRALAADAALEGALASPEAEIWLLGFRAEALIDAFPGLSGASSAELAVRLRPVVGDAGEALPMAAEVLSAELGEDGALLYHPRSWAEWSARARAGLGVSFDVADADLCGTPQVEVLEGPSGAVFDGAVAIAPEELLLTGHEAGGTRLTLYALEPSGFRALASLSETATAASDPGWDPVSESAWDVAGEGRIVHFDREGASLPVPAAPSDPEVLPQAVRVGVGLDGTLYASFRTTFTAEVGPFKQDLLFRRAGGAWTVARERTGGYGPFRVVRRDRVVIFYRCWLYFFEDRGEPNGWRQELFDAGCNSNLPLQLRALALDEDGGVTAGRQFVHLRSESWVDAHAGLEDREYLTATTLGHGRALITDAEGNFYLNRGRRWCRSPSPLPGPFTRAVSAPGGGPAYLLTGRDARVLRVGL